MTIINKEKPHHRWLTVGKGLAIALVVLLHASHIIKIGFNTESLIFFLSDNTRSLRMPLFFLISGILATFLIKKNVYFSIERCFNLYFVMVVWGLISLVRVILSPLNSEFSFLQSFMITAVSPTYWYLWALIIYTAALKIFDAAGQKAKYALIPISVISAFSATNIGTYGEEITSKAFNAYALEMTALNFVWFVSGSLFKDAILSSSYSNAIKAKSIALVSSAFLIIALWGTPSEHTIFFIISCLAWITVSIILLPILASYKLSNIFILLGQHTLIIYVTHQHFLSVFKHVLALAGYDGQSILLNDIIATAFSIASIVSAIAAEKVIRSWNLGFLVDGPLKKRVKS